MTPPNSKDTQIPDLSSFKRKNNITLKQDSEALSKEQRITFMIKLIENAAEKRNHIDKLRQYNMSITLVIFSGLFAFGLTVKLQKFTPYIISTVLALLMAILCAIDRKLHKMGHGWDGTWVMISHKLKDIINSPAQDITFPLYYHEAEKLAKRCGSLPLVYYLLFVGGACSWLAFHWAGQ